LDVKYIKVFLDNFEAVDSLDNEQRGELFTAIFRYARDGKKTKLKGAAKHVFPTFKAQIDREMEWMENVSKVRSKVGKLGGRPKKQNKQLVFEESKKSTENRVQNTENRIQSTEGGVQNTENMASAAPQVTAAPLDSPTPTPVRKGVYGWVRLTEEQYQSLRREMGDTELDWIIAYIDEKVQLNGNKYQWKDWFSVIRRAYREGWGEQERKREASAGKQMTDSGRKTSYDLEEIERLIAGGRAL